MRSNHVKQCIKILKAFTVMLFVLLYMNAQDKAINHHNSYDVHQNKSHENDSHSSPFDCCSFCSSCSIENIVVDKLALSFKISVVYLNIIAYIPMQTSQIIFELLKPPKS